MKRVRLIKLGWRGSRGLLAFLGAKDKSSSTQGLLDDGVLWRVPSYRSFLLLSIFPFQSSPWQLDQVPNQSSTVS